MMENGQVAGLLRSALGITLSMTLSYFAMKWLMKNLDPTHSEKEKQKKQAKQILKKLRIDNIELNEYELCIASDLIDPGSMSVDWKCIGGLEETITDIKEHVLLPFKHLKYASNLVQPPKGVLLYGPPGCGKTMIAKAMAKSSDANFINLQVTSLVDKYYGESQKRVEAIFTLAEKIAPTMIFIDEIDSFLRTRSSSDHEVSATMKTQFMSLWDGLNSDPNRKVMIIGATNRKQDIDSAILRRMPSTYYIGLPNIVSRKNILSIILKNEKLYDDVNIDDIADRTNGKTGSDLEELCRTAAIIRLKVATSLLAPDETDENVILAAQRFRMSDFNKALNISGIYVPDYNDIDIDM